MDTANLYIILSEARYYDFDTLSNIKTLSHTICHCITVKMKEQRIYFVKKKRENKYLRASHFNCSI